MLGIIFFLAFILAMLVIISIEDEELKQGEDDEEISECGCTSRAKEGNQVTM